MDDIERSESIKLFYLMDKIGTSERIRKRLQDISITDEIVSTIKYQIEHVPITFYVFGSSSEGTTIHNSDVDNIICDERVSVIDDIHNAPRGQFYLMIRDNHTYPGYIKLQPLDDGTLWTIYNTNTNTRIYKDTHDTDTEGRICKKHVTLCEGVHDHERHGPSDSNSGKNGVITRDNVYALKCRTIPNYAQTWLHRRRQCNWPSCDNLKKMGHLGCFVVGVGHMSSREQHIEWRLSFSLQERLLMFGLNLTQHKCYVTLKLIKNDIIKAKIGECLSSYHCKTCLFYAIENTPAAIWTPYNLVFCVRLCLMILLAWVGNGVCPNYFIPSENMFENPKFRANRYRLHDLLRGLIADKYTVTMGIRNNIFDPRILPNKINDASIMYIQYLGLHNSIKTMCNTMYTLANNSRSTLQNILTLSKHIERLSNTRIIGEHTEQQTQDAISYVTPILHLHIAQQLACLACKCQDQEHTRQLVYLSIHHFLIGNQADLMTSRLLVVSLLLRLTKYDVCVTILEEIEHDLNRYVVSKCGCYCMRYVANIDLLRLLSTNNVSCKTAIRTVFVGCVRFARCDTEIAPLPLQYEMYRSIGTPSGSQNKRDDAWFDLAAVDGKIYLYFLQYLVYSQLNRPANKQVAIDNIVWVLGDDSNLTHTETAYNLLGWIHVQEGRLLEALRCFVTSWRIRPVKNSAKWHLGIALYKYYINNVVIQ